MSYTIDPSDNVLKILTEDHYYPFGMKHQGYSNFVSDVRPPPGLATLMVLDVNDLAYKFKFGNKELQDELGLEWYDYHARNYDPAIGRWMKIDPLAENSRRWNPYNYAYNNPVYFIDPDGMQSTSNTGSGAGQNLSAEDFDVMVNIGYGRKMSANKISGAVGFSGGRVCKLVHNSTGGFYNANIDDNGNLTLVSSGLEKEMDGMINMSESQKAFTSELKELISSSVVTEVEVVSGDENIDVGSILDNIIDIADIEEFNNVGPGGATSAGALIHELKEQHEKAAAGDKKGSYPADAMRMHLQAVDVENKVNGNRRGFNKNEELFLEADGTVTRQTVGKGPNGVVKIIKENMGAPPANFKERE